MQCRWLPLVVLALALGACRDNGAPTAPVDPEPPSRGRAAQDAEIFAAAQRSAPFGGARAGLTVGILDARRTADGATVVYWNGTDYRAVRFVRRATGWTAGGVVETGEGRGAAPGSGARLNTMADPPIGEARDSLDFNTLYQYPFPPLQAGSYTHTNPTPFSGYGARYVYWSGANPVSKTVGTDVWRVYFNRWHYCRVFSGVPKCSDTYGDIATTELYESGRFWGAQTVALYYTITKESAPTAQICQGPASIGTEGTYSWKVCPGGGNGSYSYSWQYSTDGGVTWTSVGSAQTYSRTVRGGHPSFQLRATVTSGGRSASATQGVSVAIPLSASVSGTGYITQKGTYTFTASVSGGGSSPSYAWQYRYCGDVTLASCGPWTASVVGSTYTRVLSPDCGGTGEANFQKKVIVTRAEDGAQAEAVPHRTWLCGPI